MRPTFFSNIREYFDLLALKISIQISGFIEFLRVIAHYYPNSKFRRIDLSLLLSYFFKSPFLISKEFLRKKKKTDVYTYGETPLSTLEMIFKECHVKQVDIVYELGCGRGRNCFWINSFIHCKVIGIDYIPQFIEQAKAIQKKYNVADVEFRCENFLKADFSDATVIYLYGTCLEDNLIENLITRFKTLPSGTKIITVSYPLTDYCKEPIFEVIKSFQAHYPWGSTDVYLHSLMCANK